MNKMSNVKAEARNWQDVRNEIFTPQEIAESDTRITIIEKLAKTRKQPGLLKRDSKEISRDPKTCDNKVKQQQ